MTNDGRLLDQPMIDYLVHWNKDEHHEFRHASMPARGGNHAGSHLSHGLP